MAYQEGRLLRQFLSMAALLLLAPVDLCGQSPGEPAVDELLQGVKRLHYPGLPGDLLALDASVRVLVAGKTRSGTRAPVALATEWGQGRVLLFSHSLFAKKSREQLDGERFLNNCLRWLGRGSQPSVAISSRHSELASHLKALGCKVTMLKGNRLAETGAAKVWILGMSDFDRGEQARAAIGEHLHNGGGVICSGPGWGWRQLNPGKSLAMDNGVNLLLGKMGMMLGQETVRLESGKSKKMRRERAKKGVGEAGPSVVLAPGFPVLDAPSTPFQLPGALALLEDANASAPDRKQAAATLVAILSVLPLDHDRLRLLRPRLQALGGGKSRPHSQRVKKTLELKEDLLRSTAELQPGDSLGLAVPDFPGPCPSPDKPEVHEIEVGMAQGGWASTGLYVPPGRVVEVEWLAAIDGRGGHAGEEAGGNDEKETDRPMLQIGCHKDRLWHKSEWQRDPQITRSFALEARTRVWSRHGGLLYLVSKSAMPTRRLRVVGCVEAPRYILGEHDVESWQRSRALAAPWGEIEGKRIVFSLPTSVLATVEDPRPILEFWDSVVDCYETLDPQPTRERLQRVVSDRQISAGYMHAGYPIMTWMDAPAKIVDLDWVHDSKGAGPWGLFHEIGHNYQQRDWTFGGTGEVTNNVFVLYGYEKLLGRKSIKTAIRRRMPQSARTHFAAGAPFAKWKSSPFLALEMYRRLSVEFGWSAFQECFKSYRDRPLPPRASDSVKRDQWLIRFSHAAKRDLSPFFDRWGVPITQSAREQLAELPAWSGA